MAHTILTIGSMAGGVTGLVAGVLTGTPVSFTIPAGMLLGALLAFDARPVALGPHQ